MVNFGLVYPLLNSAFNYFFGIGKGSNDIEKLLNILPNSIVHSYFAIALFIYAVGLFWVLRPKEE